MAICFLEVGVVALVQSHYIWSSTSATENTNDFILTFWNQVLALSQLGQLDIKDIAKSYHSGNPSAGNAGPVLANLVKFPTYRIRALIHLDNQRDKKGQL